jgi:hypothetical protein
MPMRFDRGPEVSSPRLREHLRNRARAGDAAAGELRRATDPVDGLPGGCVRCQDRAHSLHAAEIRDAVPAGLAKPRFR